MCLVQSRTAVASATGRDGRGALEGMFSGATLRDPRRRRVFGARRHAMVRPRSLASVVAASRRGARRIYRETGRPTTSRTGTPTSVVPTVLPTKGTCVLTLEGYSVSPI